MGVFVRNLTIVLVLLSVIAGVFVEPLVDAAGGRLAGYSEIRWALILGMPVVLWVSWIRLNLQPSKSVLATVLQFLAQVALFSGPFLWIVSQAT